MENEGQKKTQEESKAVLGGVLGFFLGLIGLVIGLAMFNKDTYERKTFMKAWTIAFVVEVVLCVVVMVILNITVFSNI